MADHFRTVGVDFDGVIHSFTSGWTGYEPLDGPEPGALEFIQSLIVMDYEPVIISSRAHNRLGRQHIEDWLDRHGFPEMKVTNEKVLAVAYVDDRAVPYTPGSGEWLPVMNRVHRLAEQATTTDQPLTTVWD